MAHGLQVFNPSGGLIHDVSERLTRLIGATVISGSGSFQVPDFALGQGWFYTQPYENFAESGRTYPEVTISGTTISWTTSSGVTQSAVWLYYGVF